MKTKMKKLIAILILTFAVQGATQAQLSGLLKKAKETVKKEAVDKSTDNETHATLDAETSISTATMSEEVRQAVAKLKDPSLRAPTCWAYDTFADQGGAAFDLEDYNLMVKTHDTWQKDNVPKWKDAVRRDFQNDYAQNVNKTTEIPKAATSNPKLEAEMIAIAKGIYDDGRVPVKAIIKYADWNYTRNAFGVILDRYHTAYIIFKMSDGSHRMVDIGFKQLYNGSSYGKTQLRGIGMINSTVDYK